MTSSTRGRYMKDYLAAVRRLPPSKQEAVLSGLSELVEVIETAGNLAWLPITTNLQLTDAIFATLGDEGADSFYQNWLKRQMSAPAFTGLVRTAQALFGFDTASIAKWIPKAFDLMYKDYGTFVIDSVGPERLVIELTDMPEELARHQHWHRSVCAGLHALFFLSGAKGQVVLEGVDVGQRTLRIGLSWAR